MSQQVPAYGRRLRRTGVQSPCRFGPFEREVSDGARQGRLGQRVQRRAKNRPLALLVTWLSQQVAKRMLDGRQARNADRGREIGDARQGDRADACLFNLSLYQSYGPAADRSARDQKDDVHLIPFHLPDHSRCAVPQQHFGLQDVAHKGVVAGRRSPDLAALLELEQTL
jgi:hypothetical protein